MISIRHLLILLLATAILALPMHGLAMAAGDAKSSHMNDDIMSHGAQGQLHAVSDDHAMDTQNSLAAHHVNGVNDCSKPSQHSSQADDYCQVACDFSVALLPPAWLLCRIGSAAVNSRAVGVASGPYRSLDIPPPKSS